MIDIVVSSGVPYIWDPNDWYKLRTDHRIMGCFEGAVNGHEAAGSHCYQLPFRLTTMETQFLLKAGIARTVACPKLGKYEAPVTQERFQALRKERINEQLEELRNQRRVFIESIVDKIIEGKRKMGRGPVPDRNAIIQDELAKINSLPFEMILTDMKDPWTVPEDYAPLEFPLPRSPLEILRFKVFEDFHSRQNYYLTPGIKFGGDFLAYPGDPNKFHAEYVIICEDVDRKLSPIYLVSQERLTHSVKKTLLIAFVDERTGGLKYRRGGKRHQKIVRNQS